jgi:hypothetical protein
LKISLTFEFETREEAEHESPAILAARPGKTQDLRKADTPKASVSTKNTQTAKANPPEASTDALADDPLVETGHDSSNYIRVITEALPILQQEGFRKIAIACGHLTTAGTPAPMKEPKPSPEMQAKLIAEIEKALAAKNAAPAVDPGKLTQEAYEAEIARFSAALGPKALSGLKEAAKSVGRVNSEGKALDPKRAEPEKRAAILAFLENLVTKAEA